MKILALFLSTISAIAADVTIAWTPRPAVEAVVNYRIYEVIGTNWVPVALTPHSQASTNITVTLTNQFGFKQYSVTALNSGGEGPLSLPITTNIPPGAVTIRFTIQGASVLTSNAWQDLAAITREINVDSTTRFFRGKLDIAR